MSHRPPRGRSAPAEPDTPGAVVFDALCAPLVMAVAILIVVHVFDGVSPTAGVYARWAFFTADAVWGVAMLWSRLRKMRKASLAAQYEQER